MGVKRLHLIQELLAVLSVLGLLAWLVYFLLFRPLPPAQHESLADLQKQFRLTDKQERIKALESMGARPDLPVLPIFTGALKEKDPAIRAAAAEALGRRQDPQALPALLEAWDAADRARKAHPLEYSTIVVDDPPEEQAYWELTWTLQKLDPIGLPVLREELRAGDPAVRRRAVRALHYCSSREAQAVLLSATHDADPRVRAEAVASFSGYHAESEQICERLSALLHDTAPEVRRAAANQFRDYFGAYAPASLPGAVHDTDVLVRAAAYVALGNPRQASAYPILTAGIREQDARARAAAVNGLGALQDPRGQAVVRPLLRDPDNTVRLAALLAAGQLQDTASLSTLEAALRHGPDQETRNTAAEGLAAFSGPGVARLATALTSPNVAVRRAAAYGLAEKCQDDEAVPLLLYALAHDRDDRVRKIAMASFQLSYDERLDPVMTGLLKDPTPWVRRETCKWFDIYLGAQAGERRLHPAVPVLLGLIDYGTPSDQRVALNTYLMFSGCNYDPEPDRTDHIVRKALTSPDDAIRRIALKHLAWNGDKGVLPDLLAMLHNGSPEERAFAADLLDNYIDQGKVRRLLLGALQDHDARVRAAALDSLPEEKRYFRLFARYTRDADVTVRAHAINKLGNIKDRRAVPVLLKLLNDRSNVSAQSPLRLSVVEALCFYKDQRAINPLIALLDESDTNLQSRTAQALSEIGSPTMEPLLQAMRTASPYARRTIIESLGRNKDPRALDAIRAALHDESARVRSSAIYALNERKDTASLPALRALLNDQDEGVCSAAVSALSAMKDRASVPKILTMVRSQSARRDNSSYLADVMALGEIGDRRAVPLLLELQRSDDPNIRVSATEALAKISGNNAKPSSK